MRDQPVAAAEHDDLVAALARAAVARAAPEELPLFRATSEAYFRDPSSVTAPKRRDDVLGFGVDAAVLLISPIALQVAKDVLGFLHGALRERAREHGEHALDRLLARLVGRDAEAGAEAVELSDEELARVRAVALEKARALKLPDEKAALLADSLVGSLATA